MMGDLIHFSPRADLTARENLCEFIRMCRYDLKVFGSDLNWMDWKWPGVNFAKIGVNSRAATDVDRLDDSLIDFAKAYFRYQQGHKPTGTKNESKALRTVEAALLQVKGKADINQLDMSVLDEAAKFARISYVPMAAYHCGRELERMARFVTEKQLIGTDVGTWKTPIKKPLDVNIQTGTIAKALRDKKLPNEEALEAVARTFANHSEHPKDIFTTSTFAMTMSAPSRITEVLELPADCEVEEADKNGVLRYGWRFFSGKGYGGDIKWVPTMMNPIAKEAASRLHALTEGPRKLARWIEQNPSRFYRHADCPDVGDDDPLNAEQAAAALGVTRIAANGLSEADGAHTLNSLWRYVMSRQPAGFPWLNKKKKIKYSNALFCMTENFLHRQRGTSPVILWAPDVNVFNNDLSPRESLKTDSHKSIFDRWGFKSRDGQSLKLKSHQARHLLNTIANRGGLSKEQIAKWSGRADPKQNRVYNHMSEYEMVAAAEAMDTSLTLFGPKGEVSQFVPISAQEFNLMERGPVHVTLFGICVHDWILTPCEKFRSCLVCEEHVCVKGDAERLKRVKARLAEVEKDYAEARDSIAKGFAGADRWYESHEKTVTRLRQLVAILESPDLPDGSQVKLRDGKDFSHLRRAIRAKAVGALERGALDAELLSEMNQLLGGGSEKKGGGRG